MPRKHDKSTDINISTWIKLMKHKGAYVGAMDLRAFIFKESYRVSSAFSPPVNYFGQ